MIAAALLAAAASGPPPAAVVARFDCQVRGERLAHREIISLSAWEAMNGASIEREFDGYSVNDTGHTQLYRNEPGKFVVRISNGNSILTLERIEEGSGRFFRYGSSVMSHHNYMSTYGGFCSAEIIQAPSLPPPKGNKP